MRTCVFLLAALAVAGCHWDLNDKSTDPETDQLYFPAGIVMDPDGRFAYVSNGNADLRFGGGTVQMVDMLSFECTIAEYRKYSKPADPVNDPNTPIPTWCNFMSDQDWIQFANYNAKCARNALDPSIVECDESAFILQNSTVRVGNFAGAIRLLPDPSDPLHRTLFVAVRGDPSVTRIDVHFPGSTSANPGATDIYTPTSIDQPGVLQCVSSPSTLATRPEYNPTTHETSSPAPCDATFLVQDYYCQYQPNCTVGVNNNGKTQLPAEPFGMVVDNSNPTNRRLLVSHLATGQVSVIGVDVPPSQALLSESTEFFPPDPTGRHGAFALAQQSPSDPHSLWYVTSNVNPLVATFRVADANVITVAQQSQFVLSSTFAQGTDVRDFIFDNDGNRAFMTENNPPSLLVVDTRNDPSNANQPRNVITDVVDVCLTPSHMGMRQIGGQTKAIVVCFLSSQVMIVDPNRPGVDATIFSGFSGPNDITFNFSDPGVTPVTQQIIPNKHAYVTNYSESTIAVVDLEPSSPTQNRVIGKLGHPLDGINP